MRDVFLANIAMQVVERHFLRDIAGVVEPKWKDPKTGKFDIEKIKELVAGDPNSEQKKLRLEKDVKALRDLLNELDGPSTSDTNGVATNGA